jgi:lamin tail-like protein
MILFKNIVEQIHTFISALRRTYDQQGRIGKILIPGLFLLVFCCFCSILSSLLPLRNSQNPEQSPNTFPSQEPGAATPTALFNFGTVTFVPFPTFPTSTTFPTLTALPTETQTPIQILPTATGTALPTVTSPPATATSGGTVMIVTVNKPTEYVDIQNFSNAPVDLSGWKLVSETGNQSCSLSGVLQPNEPLRIWARTGDPGLSCGFSFNIWNDNQADAAVLYNAQGEEVDRSP